MSALIIDGRALAHDLRIRTADAAAKFTAQTGVKPGLAAVLVGENAASASYVRAKIKACAEAGLNSLLHQLPARTTGDELLDCIDALNSDPAVHGILLQLPLPSHLPAQAFLGAIDPLKDVDGFHPVNAGLLAAGAPGFVPCTPQGCLQLIESATPQLGGLHAVILGRSLIVGRPLAQLLLMRDCTVTIAHSRSRDVAGLARQADILIAATGQPELVTADWVKPGATVIDVGISRVNDRLVGDVAFDEVRAVAGAITPVPGGVGPMTIANLLANTVRAGYGQSDGGAAA